MNISANKMSIALRQAIQEHPKQADAIIKRFMVFCKTHHLIPLVPRVLSLLQRTVKEERKRDTVRMVSARKMDRKIVELIKRTHDIPSTAPEQVEIDKSIIGGFMMYHHNHIYDGSIKGQLHAIRRTLV